jgi:hypothetical protein
MKWKLQIKWATAKVHSKLLSHEPDFGKKLKIKEHETVFRKLDRASPKAS